VLSVGSLVANSPAHNWDAVFVVSKAILVQARPPGSIPGMYSFRRTSRRIRYGRIVHTSCAESKIDYLRNSGSTLPPCLIRKYLHKYSSWGPNAAKKNAQVYLPTFLLRDSDVTAD
jgi:hypothetical protein